MSQTLPELLPILPLPLNTVLFPNLLISIQLQSTHGIALIRSVVNEAAKTPSGSSKLVLACVPLKPVNSTPPDGIHLLTPDEPKGSTPKEHKGEDSATSDDGKFAKNENRNLKVIRIPSDRDTGIVADSLPDGRPLPEELYEYATAARIVRLERLSSGGFLAVLEGLSRISIDPTTYPSPPSLSAFYTARISPLSTVTSLPVSHASLLTRLRDVSTSLLTTLQDSATPLPPLFDRRLRSQLSRLSASTCLSFLDTIFSSLPVSPATSLDHYAKCQILSIPAAADRLEFGLEVLSRINETVRVTKSIDEKVDKTVNRRQREYVLMQQLLAIKQELDQIAATETSNSNSSPGGARGSKPRKISAMTGEDDAEDGDEMIELEKKIAEKAFSEEARNVATRELKRLKKTPPQGAEYGVIRNYLETLLAIPWTTAEATTMPLSRDFITQARTKLDQDHYGLVKIKKRLLEWLAVLRLQQEQASELEPAPVTARPSNSVVAASTEHSISASTAVVPYTPPVPQRSVAAASPTKFKAKSPILLLHGPPGTGKTSIARSLAEAMGRKFVRISLGGVRDEAEIRGHRRTYVGAMPGKIVAAMKKAGTSNPVILLDEIDKMGQASHHGDPSAAMLEVLDPEQNWCFEDHYLGVPIDLSQVLFIATANSLDTISDPLYDRMEPVELSGYIHDEKLFIARQKLLPKQLAANALEPTSVTMNDSTLLYLIQHYTREAGVRSLERELGAVCRAKAVEFAEARDGVRGQLGEEERGKIELEAITSNGYRSVVEAGDLESLLGHSKYEAEEVDTIGKIGVATGLAYQGSGNGGVLHIETTLMPGSGRFHLTGQLGEVISESARLALAWVKSHAFELGIATKIDDDVFKHCDLHLHLPAGSVKKDGPSAGVAIVVAIVSLMRGIPPKPRVAMTGEITLRGDITPVGGIKEKLLGAHRSGIKTVVLPFKNRKDVVGIDAGLPQRVLDEIEITYVRSLADALKATLPDFDHLAKLGTLEVSRL